MCSNKPAEQSKQVQRSGVDGRTWSSELKSSYSFIHIVYSALDFQDISSSSDQCSDRQEGAKSKCDTTGMCTPMTAGVEGRETIKSQKERSDHSIMGDLILG